MNESKLFKNATLVNEGKTFVSDVLVVGERIEKLLPLFRPKHTPKPLKLTQRAFYLFQV